MAQEVVIENKPTIFGRSSIIVALGVGAFVGFLGWVVTLAINNWVLVPVFCRSADTAAVCSNAGAIAWVIAHILLSIVGLFMLIRAGVFRPLLVVLAALVTLWAIGLWFLPAIWWVGLVWETLLFALAYALYTWIASAGRFVYALLGIVVLAILFRILIAL